MTKSRGLLWPLLAVLSATIPVAGLFTLTRIFFVRDLTLTFRSRFLFLRHAVFSGAFPFWDPYPANGQPAVTDALNQLFHLPSLLLRLLWPEVVAYNLWVALPVPLAAIGMYVFLRRQVRPPAAAIGACAFAVGGPIVSTTNFPNMSWSVAAIPYVFWTVERLLDSGSARDASFVAIAVALQALAGEPVSWVATLGVAGAYIAFGRGAVRNVRLLAACAAALLAGVLLAAIQFVPLYHAGSQSVRAVMLPNEFWSFHPLAIVELIVPHFFGDYFNSHLQELAWMTALNSQREPFYYTMYVGVPVVLAAAVAAMSGRPRTTFWTVAVVACILGSLGGHTPFYPALQKIVAPLRSFRFPVKYLSLAAFGIATLASFTIEWIAAREVPRRALTIAITVATLTALCAYGLVAWLLVAPRVPVRMFFDLAALVQVPSPVQGAEYLIFRARPLLTALFLKLICGSFLLWIAASSRRERHLAAVVFGAVIVVDLVASNSSVNPTIDREWMAPPVWTRQIPADLHERVYIGGRTGGFVDVTDTDAPKYRTYFEGMTELEQRFVVVNELAYNPSGLGLRESVSYDLPEMWPLDYTRVIDRFTHASRAERFRYLGRSGVRFEVMSLPPFPGARPLAAVRGFEQSKLYDANPAARRVYVVPDALMGRDVMWQLEGLFQARFNPDTGVLVSAPPPPPSGIPGLRVPASASFLTDGINEVVVAAGLPADGYLALLDSYDPDWQVTVDGTPAPLMRANGLFRAVHLRAGPHTVRFTYHSRALRIGSAISVTTALALVAWCVMDPRRRRQIGA